MIVHEKKKLRTVDHKEVLAFSLVRNEARWLPGALTILGTIVNGAAMTWVTTQRNAAVGEEKAAFEDLVRLCGTPQHVALVQSLTAGSALPPELSNTPWYREVHAATESSRAFRQYIAHIRD